MNSTRASRWLYAEAPGGTSEIAPPFIARRGELPTALIEPAFADVADPWWAPYARAAGAELAVVAGLPDAEGRLMAAAPAATENDWAAACLLRAGARLSGDTAELLGAAERFDRIDARFEVACTLLLIPERVDEGMAMLSELRVPPPLSPDSD